MARTSYGRFTRWGWSQLAELSKKFDWITVEYIPFTKFPERASIYISVNYCNSIWLKDAEGWKDDSTSMELMSAAFAIIKSIELHSNRRFVRNSDGAWKVVRKGNLPAIAMPYTYGREEINMLDLIVEVLKTL